MTTLGHVLKILASEPTYIECELFPRRIYACTGNRETLMLLSNLPFKLRFCLRRNVQIAFRYY